MKPDTDLIYEEYLKLLCGEEISTNIEFLYKRGIITYEDKMELLREESQVSLWGKDDEIQICDL